MIEEIHEFIDGFISRDHIEKYIEYGTCMYVPKVAFIAFNIKKNTAHIIYMKIKKGESSIHIMNYFVKNGLKKFPYVRYIEWEREIIGDNSKRRMDLWSGLFASIAAKNMLEEIIGKKENIAV